MPGFRETADQRLPQYTVGPGYNGIDDNTPKGKGSGWRPKNVIPAKQAVSKRQLRGAKGQSVIPVPLRHSRESGNPGVVEGCYNGVSPLHPAWIPAFQAVSKRHPSEAQTPEPVIPAKQAVSKLPPLLWERVGVREPRGKQAGVNGNEWERQGYWGPSPGLRPPSPRGRGVGFGTSRTGLRPPSPRGRGVGFGTGRTGLRPPSPRGRGF